MILSLRCRACDHRWQLRDDPDALVALRCLACGHAALARASEDFAAAVEDALCQLHLLGQSFDLQLACDSQRLPPAFAPAALPPPHLAEPP